MAVDKAINQAPLGLDATLEAGAVPGINVEPDLEIEIEDPESVRIAMDGLEIELEPGEEYEDSEFNENLAEMLDNGQLAEIAGDLIGDFDDDLASRRDWIQTYVDGLELLGMKVEDRTEPWPGACGVYHLLLTEAVV